ncbi:MAG TPA: O-antigen ligase family protein, partial [Anaerolineales bacterium]
YAFALALVFPVGVFFMLQTKNVVAKLVWGAMLLAMVYCVVLTLSRGGLLALAAAVLLVLWQFGIKRKRRYLIPLAVLGALAIVAVSPGQFAARVESIFNPTLDATGSGWARRELLSRAIDVTLASPLLGVGPGNFPVLSGNWKGAHNTYLQLSAEGGIPALLIYFVILGYSFRNLRRIQRQSSDPQIQDLTSALFAALGCYVIGAFFADTVYHFFPFLIFGYVSALYIYVTSLAQPAEGVEAAGSARESQKVPQARSNPFLEGWQRDKGAARLASLRETHVRNRRNR